MTSIGVYKHIWCCSFEKCVFGLEILDVRTGCEGAFCPFLVVSSSWTLTSMYIVDFTMLSNLPSYLVLFDSRAALIVLKCHHYGSWQFGKILRCREQDCNTRIQHRDKIWYSKSFVFTLYPVYLLHKSINRFNFYNTIWLHYW